MTNSERRRSIRRPVSLDAVVTGGDQGSLACRIQDFCPNGLFIAVSGLDENDSIVLDGRSLNPGDTIEVQFSVDAGEQSGSFKVTARIAGTFSGGMGVQFPEAEPDAIRALNAAADKQANSRDRGKTTVERPERSFSRAESAAMVESIGELLSDFLQEKGAAVFEAADETLFTKARDATSNTEETKFIECQRDVKKLQPAVCKAFLENGMRGWKQPGQAPTDPESKDAIELGEASELSILDSGSFHDVLKVKQILGRCERRFKDVEYALEQRLSLLLGVPFDEDSNPVGVRAICFAFHDAMQDLGAHQLARGHIFEAFESIAVGNLDGLHSGIGSLLDGAGFATKTEKRSFRVPVSPRSPHPEPAPPGDGQGIEGPYDAGVASPDYSETGTPRPPAPVGGSLPPGMPGPATPSAAVQPGALHQEYMDDERGAVHGQALEAAVAAAGPHPGGVAARPGIAAGNAAVLMDGFAAAQSLLRWGRSPSSSHAVFDGSSGISPSVIEAIVRLQQHFLQDPMSQTGPMALKDRVLATISDEGDDASEAERDAISIVTNLINSVTEDTLISTGAKSRIRWMALPLLRIALSDPTFFDDLSHPARGIVNVLGYLEFEGDDAADIQSRVDPLLERLVEDTDADQDLISEISDALRGIADEQQEQFRQRAEEVGKSREQETTIIKSRVSETRREGARRPVPEELRQWLDRARRLKVGDAVVFEPGPGKRRREVLAWLSGDMGKFQFVDRRGNKASWLTDQQLAIEMRRGSAFLVPGSELPVLERGVYQMLHDMHSKLTDVAIRDELTGLLNRRAFTNRLDEALEDARRISREHSLCLLELDGFDNIINRCGPKAGPALLRQLARMLEKNLSVHSGSVARVDTNLFAILLNDVTGTEGQQFAERQRNAIAQSRCTWKDESFSLSASIGVVAAGSGDDDAEELLASAREACLRATEAGGNCVIAGWAPDSVVSESMNQDSGRVSTRWTGKVSESLESGLVVLRKQCVLPLADDNGEKPCYEILPGIREENGGVRDAQDLLRAAEREDLVVEVDRWVLASTLRWMAENRKSILKSGGFAINLSASSVTDRKFIDFVIEQLTETKVPPAKVQIEIKEHIAIDNLLAVSEFIHVLREYGCRFSLDQFGTGDASYAYLKRVSVDFLKIDGSFVRDMIVNENDLAVVRSVNEIGHLLGIQTIAESVASKDHMDSLREIGVDFAQGEGVEPPVLLSPEG